MRREHSVFYGFLKFITQQIFKICYKSHVWGAPRLAPQYSDDAMTIEQQSRMIIEVEMDAQELVVD